MYLYVHTGPDMGERVGVARTVTYSKSNAEIHAMIVEEHPFCTT